MQFKHQTSILNVHKQLDSCAKSNNIFFFFQTSWLPWLCLHELLRDVRVLVHNERCTGNRRSLLCPWIWEEEHRILFDWVASGQRSFCQRSLHLRQSIQAAVSMTLIASYGSVWWWQSKAIPFTTLMVHYSVIFIHTNCAINFMLACIVLLWLLGSWTLARCMCTLVYFIL